MSELSLDSESLGPVGKEFFEFATKRMKGQETAIRRLAKALDHAASPLREENKPIYTVLLVGGAGSGKTHLVKVLSEFWFKNPDGAVSINCSRFQETVFSQSVLIHSDYVYQCNYGPQKVPLRVHQKLIKKQNELAEKLESCKLSLANIGDPEKVAAAQELIAELEKKNAELIYGIQSHQLEIQPVFDNLRSILVLDHIELADPDFHEELYDMLETGERIKYLPQEGYQKVSLANSVIFITCSDLVKISEDSDYRLKSPLGFQAAQSGAKNTSGNEIHLAGMKELKDYLSPKILSRIVRVEFFRPYTDESRLEIVNLFFEGLSEKLAEKFPVVLNVNEEVKRFIVKEGKDHPEMGIRLLKHKFDKYITWKLENLVQKGLIKADDFLDVSLEEVTGKKYVVFRKVDVVNLPPA